MPQQYYYSKCQPCFFYIYIDQAEEKQMMESLKPKENIMESWKKTKKQKKNTTISTLLHQLWL